MGVEKMGTHCQCGEEAIVGVGKDATPLCLTHFQDYLAGTRKVMDKARGI